MKNTRRGQTWQNRDWRDVLTNGSDLNARARSAFAKERAQRKLRPLPKSMHSLARMAAPFTGDGIPAGGPFIIRPEFRSFA